MRSAGQHPARVVRSLGGGEVNLTLYGVMDLQYGQGTIMTLEHTQSYIYTHTAILTASNSFQIWNVNLSLLYERFILQFTGYCVTEITDQAPQLAA